MSRVTDKLRRIWARPEPKSPTVGTVKAWIAKGRASGQDALGVANDPEWPTTATVTTAEVLRMRAHIDELERRLADVELALTRAGTFGKLPRYPE